MTPSNDNLDPNYDPFALGRLTVILQPPGVSKPLIWENRISHDVWAEFFRPLPRDREVPWAPIAQEEAKDLIIKRKHLSDVFSQQIAQAIRAALFKQDPQFGFRQKNGRK